jgi:hypothetical protein
MARLRLYAEAPKRLAFRSRESPAAQGGTVIGPLRDKRDQADPVPPVRRFFGTVTLDPARRQGCRSNRAGVDFASRRPGRRRCDCQAGDRRGTCRRAPGTRGDQVDRRLERGMPELGSTALAAFHCQAWPDGRDLERSGALGRAAAAARSGNRHRPAVRFVRACACGSAEGAAKQRSVRRRPDVYTYAARLRAARRGRGTEPADIPWSSRRVGPDGGWD